jgi:hypothetical protein
VSRLSHDTDIRIHVHCSQIHVVPTGKGHCVGIFCLTVVPTFSVPAMAGMTISHTWFELLTRMRYRSVGGLCTLN